MRKILTTVLLATLATVPAALAQTPKAPAAPATKAACEKVKDMKWDDKGGADHKGACVAVKAEAPKK